MKQILSQQVLTDYNYFITTITNEEIGLMERNSFVFDFINKLVKYKKLETIRMILKSDEILNVHASLMKSTLLITESVSDTPGFLLLRSLIETRMNRVLPISENIKHKEVDLGNGNKIAVFNYAGDGDPVKHLNDAIVKYTGNENFTEFVDMNMDNPWVRIVVIGDKSTTVI